MDVDDGRQSRGVRSVWRLHRGCEPVVVRLKKAGEALRCYRTIADTVNYGFYVQQDD